MDEMTKLNQYQPPPPQNNQTVSSLSNTTPTPPNPPPSDKPSPLRFLEQLPLSKILLSLLLIVGLAAGVIIVQRSQESRRQALSNNVELSLTPESRTIDIGQETDLFIFMDTNDGQVAGADVSVTIDDSSIAQIIDITRTNFFNQPDNQYGSLNARSLTKTVNNDNARLALVVPCDRCYLGNNPGTGIPVCQANTTPVCYPTDQNATGNIMRIRVRGVTAGTTTLRFDTAASQIAAVNQADNSNVLENPTSTAAITVNSNEPPPAPTNLSPNGTTSCNPYTLEFTWDAVTGATEYLLRLDNTNNPWASCANLNPGDECLTLNTNSHTIQQPNPDTTYNWWVHASNENGTSDSTHAQAFIPACPATPSNLDPTTTTACGLTEATFSWDPVPEASDYLLRIDDLSNPWTGSCTNVNSGDSCLSLAETSYTREVQPGSDYHWWVHSRNQYGLSGPAHAEPSVPHCPLPAPNNLSPTGTSACGLTELTFNWDPVNGANDYILRLDNASNGWASCANPNPGDSCHTLTNTSYTATVSPGSTILWNVNARDAQGAGDRANAEVTIPTCQAGDYHPPEQPDGDVDIDDFFELITNFGTYTISQFNEVIKNFGSGTN